MISDARRTSRMQHVTTTGAALAGALLPLAVGMLLARSVGADPMAPVNALITSGGQRARLDRCQLRAVRPTREGRAGVSGLTRPVLTRRALRDLSVREGRSDLSVREGRSDLSVREVRPVRTALRALPRLRDLAALPRR
ncbi:hypothetical protein [Streptomyces sp. NPDC013457]|uniref:hypothetical protein n=1 Tax=Streptomyces sp. NPDC013457 TaxID=3364866 RepID=UPI0036FAAB9C